MKKLKLSFLLFFIIFCSICGFAQQTSFWYKISEQVDKTTNKRTTLKNTAYFRVIITSKGIILFTVEDQQDLKNAIEGNSRNSYFHPFVNEYSPGRQAVAEANNRTIIISTDGTKVNLIYGNETAGYVYIGNKSNEPSLSLFASTVEYPLFKRSAKHFIYIPPLQLDQPYQNQNGNSYTQPSTQTTCGYCDGTGRIHDDVATYGNTENKWCEGCHAWVHPSHCHRCKTCPSCGGKGYR